MKLVRPLCLPPSPNHSMMSTSAPPTLAVVASGLYTVGCSQNDACWPRSFWNFIRAAATP